ncbi:hypothetical protein TNCV_1568371 [Trichonephila clavipes]|nr:hypothetical protein TNCV_1568371 [Trichonephila clavipes]
MGPLQGESSGFELGNRQRQAAHAHLVSAATESMAWRVIGRLECGQTQRRVANAVGVARSVVERLWNRFQKQEMLDVDQGQVGHVPLHQLMTGIYS